MSVKNKKLEVVRQLVDGVVAHKTKMESDDDLEGESGDEMHNVEIESMSEIRNIKSDDIKRLDNEIIRADELVVSLHRELNKIDADKENCKRKHEGTLKSLDRESADTLRSLDNELEDTVRSLDNELTDYIALRDRKLADTIKTVDDQIAAAVSALSLGQALRDQILGLRGQLETLETHWTTAEARQQQIEMQIRLKRESIGDKEGEIRNLARKLKK